MQMQGWFQTQPAVLPDTYSLMMLLIKAKIMSKKCKAMFLQN